MTASPAAWTAVASRPMRFVPHRILRGLPQGPGKVKALWEGRSAPRRKKVASRKLQVAGEKIQVARDGCGVPCGSGALRRDPTPTTARQQPARAGHRRQFSPRRDLSVAPTAATVKTCGCAPHPQASAPRSRQDRIHPGLLGQSAPCSSTSRDRSRRSIVLGPRPDPGQLRNLTQKSASASTGVRRSRSRDRCR
jgi:hypothetical protein